MNKCDSVYIYGNVVAPKIRVLCKMMRISIGDLSEKLGYNRKTVANWFNGLIVPNVIVFQEICKVLNVPMELMLSEKDLNLNYGNLQDCPKIPTDRRSWLIAHHRCTYCYKILSPTYDYLACPTCQVKYLSHFKD